MSKLALGTAQFGLPYGIANQRGQVSRAEAKAILALAKSSGINTLDTAIGYGESEACLGQMGTAGFNVITKLPAIPVSCKNIKEWVQETILESLGRLKLPGVYGLLLHRPADLLGTQGPELYEALQAMKAEGKLQKIGVSIYEPDELDTLFPRFEFDLVQAPFNVFDRRLQTSGWLARLSDSNVEVHIRSLFLQGLLLMARSNLPSYFNRFRVLLDHWYAWLDERSITALQACLGLLNSQPEISKCIVGVDSVEQLTEIIASADKFCQAPAGSLVSEELALIDPRRWSTA